MKRLWLLPLLAFLVGCPPKEDAVTKANAVVSAVSTGNEKLYFLLPPGSKIAVTKAVKGMEMVQYVPADQSAEDWRDALAVLVMDRRMLPDLDSVLGQRRQFFLAACAVEPVIGEPQYLSDGPYPAYLQASVCGQTQDGTGAAMAYKVILGTTAVFQVERGWRLDAGAQPSPAEVMAWGRETLSAVHLCDITAPRDECIDIAATAK